MVRGELQTNPTEAGLELYQGGHVYVECNLLDFPLCLLSDNNLKKLLREAVETGRSHIRYEMVDSDGTTRVWQVEPNALRGYTTTFDKDVVFAVFKLITDEQFPPPILWKLGSSKRVCETLKIVPQGKNLRRVKEALQRIAGTPIYAETFYLKQSKSYWREKPEGLGGVFTLWNVFWKNEKLPTGEPADAIYLQLNIPCIVGLREFYVKSLDWEYWLRLSPLQKRLYELTGRKFFGLKDSTYAKFTYPELCQRLPIVPQKHFSKAQEVLDRAHEGLTKDKWFAHIEWIGGKERPVFNPEQPWEIRYFPGTRSTLEIAQAKERLRRLQMKRVREELPQWLDVQVWVKELSGTLGDRAGRNTGYYTKLAKLITKGRVNSNLIWESLSVARSEDLAGRARSGRSAVFTDHLKRRLKGQGLDLNLLLQEV